MLAFRMILSLVLGIVLAGSAYAAKAPEPTQTAEGNFKFLFIETAKNGNMQKDKIQQNMYVITLKDVDPWAIYFNHKPERITGFMPIENFLQVLENDTKMKYQTSFNASLVALTLQNKTLRYMITINNPVYDKNTQTLILTAHIKSSEQKQSAAADHNDFQHVALFVDPICASCSGDPF